MSEVLLIASATMRKIPATRSESFGFVILAIPNLS
jgi:hypothetical protein